MKAFCLQCNGTSYLCRYSLYNSIPEIRGADNQDSTMIFVIVNAIPESITLASLLLSNWLTAKIIDGRGEKAVAFRTAEEGNRADETVTARSSLRHAKQLTYAAIDHTM